MQVEFTCDYCDSSGHIETKEETEIVYCPSCGADISETTQGDVADVDVSRESDLGD